MELIDANKLRNALIFAREQKRITPDLYDELLTISQDVEEEISKRETPMNPEEVRFGDFCDKLCPTCSHGLADEDGETVNFCPNCGQRIQA